MVFSMRMVHQSNEAFRPLTKVGLHTRPRVLEVEVSGVKVGVEPVTNGTFVCSPGPSAGATPEALS
ncbi:hypothetical protein D3C81_2332800 [compost metagenome]